MSALAVSTAMVRGSLPSESRTPRSAPRFRNRQANLDKIAKFSRPLTPSGAFLLRPSSLLSLPRVAKNGCVVEWAPASVVHLVHVCPVLEKKLTGQKRILHGEIENGERRWQIRDKRYFWSRVSLVVWGGRLCFFFFFKSFIYWHITVHVGSVLQ